MRQLALLIFIGTGSMLYGCSSDDSSASIPEPTFRITSQNADSVNESVYDVMSGEIIPDIDSLLEGDFRGITSSSRVLPNNVRTAIARSTSINESLSNSCSVGGSISGTFKGQVDENSGDGKIDIDMKADSCVEFIGGDTTVEFDGRIKGPFEFKGFDGFDFDQFSYRLDLDGLSISRFLGTNLDGFTRLSGRETGSYQDGQGAVDYRLSLSSSTLGGERVTLETTKTIKSNFSGVISGEWRAMGADGTVINYVVVPNGVEYQVNDDTPVLLTWNDLGWMADSNNTNDNALTFSDLETLEVHYQPIDDGSVIRDNWTGLEWKRCSVGQKWDYDTERCEGRGEYLVWSDAITLTEPGGFRIPTARELRTLVFCSNTGSYDSNGDDKPCGPEGKFEWPTIDTEAFPPIFTYILWTGTTDARITEAKYIDFDDGAVYADDKNSRAWVRLVRDGR